MIVLSLKSRVGLAVGSVLVVSLVAISVVMFHEFGEFLLETVDKTLTSRSGGIVTVLTHELETPNRAEWSREVRSLLGPPGKRSPILRVRLEGHQEDLLTSDPPDSDRLRWLGEVPMPDASEQANPDPVDIGPPGQTYRALWLRGRTAGGTGFHVVLAESSRYVYHEMKEFRNFLLVVGGIALLASGGLVYAAVKWGLRPVDKVTAQLATVTHRNLGDQELSGADKPAELRPFVQSTGDLLGRLDKAFEHQKQFTGDAAHELRTPLAVAKSTLQAAEMEQVSGAEYDQNIREALEDLGRIEQLIEQLLILARVDQTGEPSDIEDIRLDRLLSEVADAQHAAASRSGGSVVLRESPPVVVRGTSEPLRRLFRNVVDNAVRHGPAGRAVSIDVNAESPERVTVTVHDEGGGIPADALPHLFDRFYRVDASRSRVSGGTGLGLAIAREIALQHGGDITITSSPRAGTTVSVCLPTHPSAECR